MDYREFGDCYVVRIDRGEEILESIRKLAEREKIGLASVQALGAVGEFTVGVYSVPEKKYYSHDYAGDFEIVSLTGSITTMNGQFYSHIHMSAADRDCHVYGGHLNRAVVSATCEMFVTLHHGEVDRRYDGETGLNLFHFED